MSNEKKLIDFINQIKNETPLFLESLKINNQTGQFRFTKSADIINIENNYGLAQTTFVIRILYILNLLDNYDKQNLSKFILNFQNKNFEFLDKTILRKTLIKRLVKAVLKLDYTHLNTDNYIQSQTRQSIAALINLGINPVIKNFYLVNKKDILSYINKLDWKNPWGAGSQINHKLFFLNLTDSLSPKEKLEIAKIFLNSVNNQIKNIKIFENFNNNQIIGCYMKLFMAFNFFDLSENLASKKLLTKTINFMNSQDACEKFNSLFVIKNCLNQLGMNKDECIEISFKFLDEIKKFYYPGIGGFSFYLNKCASYYHGAKVSQSYDEPDLHGTAMYIWGIYLIADINKLNVKLNLKEPLL